MDGINASIFSEIMYCTTCKLQPVLLCSLQQNRKTEKSGSNDIQITKHSKMFTWV